METKGINILKEKLMMYNGEDVVINIFHKLYGDQKIQCNLYCICDEGRIGFKTNNGQYIFINQNDVIDYGVKDGIYFADDVMKIMIKIV